LVRFGRLRRRWRRGLRRCRCRPSSGGGCRRRWWLRGSRGWRCGPGRGRWWWFSWSLGVLLSVAGVVPLAAFVESVGGVGSGFVEQGVEFAVGGGGEVVDDVAAV